MHPEERDRIRELKELLNEQVKLLDAGLHLMKTMDRVHGTGLSDMLRSLSEILKDIKESLGMQSSAVHRSSSHLSVSSVRVSIYMFSSFHLSISSVRVSMYMFSFLHLSVSSVRVSTGPPPTCLTLLRVSVFQFSCVPI